MNPCHCTVRRREGGGGGGGEGSAYTTTQPRRLRTIASRQKEGMTKRDSFRASVGSHGFHASRQHKRPTQAGPGQHKAEVTPLPPRSPTPTSSLRRKPSPASAAPTGKTRTSLTGSHMERTVLHQTLPPMPPPACHCGDLRWIDWLYAPPRSRFERVQSLLFLLKQRQVY